MPSSLGGVVRFGVHLVGIATIRDGLAHDVIHPADVEVNDVVGCHFADHARGDDKPADQWDHAEADVESRIRRDAGHSDARGK